MEQQITVAIQSFLCPGDKCVAYIQAGLVQVCVQSPRIVVLIEHGDEYGLLVCIPSKTPVASSEDLKAEMAFPVQEGFRCELDTSDVPNCYIKIQYQKHNLLFEAPLSQRVNGFVGHVSRALEQNALRLDPLPNFLWLKKYVPTMSFEEESLMDQLNADCPSINSFPEGEDLDSGDPLIVPEQDILDGGSPKPPPRRNNKGKVMEEFPSPDFENLPRESIARGATPLAARESAIHHQMAMMENEYTDMHTFRIFCGTWNVNGQYPSCSLLEWLSCDPMPPDIYAVGFQELDLSKEAFVFAESPREEEWYLAVINALHPKAKYKLVKLVRLVGMMLVVFVHEKHAAHIHSVYAETVGTGILSKLGNKGAVAIRLEFHATTMCFVNCHLAAHVDEYERRNQDYQDICTRLIFSAFKPPKHIKNHDQIYWIGDMNYRIMDLTADQVKHHLEKKNYSLLLEHDQLTIQKNLKRIFVGFSEGPLKFMPTYKYNTGTNEWDSSEKNRPPAWCDRILWKGKDIQQLCYRSHPSLVISDHKPVSALFNSQVKVINQPRHRQIYQEVMKRLDKLENEFLPQVVVDKMEVNFNHVTFYETSIRYLTIANTGMVPVQFEFIKKLNDTSYCKEWLEIKPYTDFLMPGEKCDIELKVHVDKRSAYKLNSGQDQIFDILVLHLERGKDIFVTVTGSYVPSSFGTSLEALVKMNKPIREVPVDTLLDLEGPSKPGQNDTDQKDFDIPKEIWLLVDYLVRFGMTQEDLFEQPGLHSDIEHIRDRLDTGWSEISAASIHSVAEALLLFLESLPEPVIPYKFHPRCLEASANFNSCKQIIGELPKVHRNVFRYLVLFLRELLRHSVYNKLEAKMLASIFGSILLKSPPNNGDSTDNAVQQGYKKVSQHLQERKKATFVLQFLMNDFLETTGPT